MSTNLEKTLLQLGCTKSDDCNVDSDITTFSIINSSNLESSTTSAQAENEYFCLLYTSDAADEE